MKMGNKDALSLQGVDTEEGDVASQMKRKDMPYDAGEELSETEGGTLPFLLTNAQDVTITSSFKSLMMMSIPSACLLLSNWPGFCHVNRKARQCDQR